MALVLELDFSWPLELRAEPARSAARILVEASRGTIPQRAKPEEFVLR